MADWQRADEEFRECIARAEKRFEDSRKRPQMMVLPIAETLKRRYDAETERLERFLRGQRVLAEMESAA